jgi:excisionase family DNA binding protein
MTDSKRLLTLEEAARYLGVSKISLRRWTNDGQLSCHRVGVRRERRFEKKMLDAFLGLWTEDKTILAARSGVVDRLEEMAQMGRQRHIATFYRDRTEQWDTFRPYFLRHYRAELPTVYLHEAAHGKTVMEHVRAEGINPRDAVRRGLLRLIPAHESYLRTGAFSADLMIAFVRRAIARMEAKGQRRFLFTGEMGWYFTGAEGVEEIHDYERRLNLLLDGHPEVTIVCQYDLSRFDAGATLEACCSHPVVDFNDHLHKGLYTRP